MHALFVTNVNVMEFIHPFSIFIFQDASTDLKRGSIWIRFEKSNLVLNILDICNTSTPMCWDFFFLHFDTFVKVCLNLDFFFSWLLMSCFNLVTSLSLRSQQTSLEHNLSCTSVIKCPLLIHAKIVNTYISFSWNINNHTTLVHTRPPNPYNNPFNHSYFLWHKIQTKTKLLDDSNVKINFNPMTWSFLIHSFFMTYKMEPI
jgi:hypothetical protein